MPNVVLDLRPFRAEKPREGGHASGFGEERQQVLAERQG